MERYSCKKLKSLVASGVAKDVTYANERSDIPESYTQIGYAAGIYGCNGMLLKGESGQLYAVIGRTSAIYIFSLKLQASVWFTCLFLLSTKIQKYEYTESMGCVYQGK